MKNTPSPGASLRSAKCADAQERSPVPEPTTVKPAHDGHPSGRHMIDAFRMMSVAARTSGGKHQRDMADVYDLAATCIENEAKRADRAEAALAQADIEEILQQQVIP